MELKRQAGASGQFEWRDRADWLGQGVPGIGLHLRNVAGIDRKDINQLLATTHVLVEPFISGFINH